MGLILRAEAHTLGNRHYCHVLSYLQFVDLLQQKIAKYSLGNLQVKENIMVYIFVE